MRDWFDAVLDAIDHVAHDDGEMNGAYAFLSVNDSAPNFASGTLHFGDDKVGWLDAHLEENGEITLMVQRYHALQSLNQPVPEVAIREYGGQWYAVVEMIRRDYYAWDNAR